jgi:hypothetical protein
MLLLLLMPCIAATLIDCGSSFATQCGRDGATEWCGRRTSACGCTADAVAQTSQCAGQVARAVFPVIAAQRVNTWTRSTNASQSTLNVNAAERVSNGPPGADAFMVSNVIADGHGTDDLQFLNLSLAPSLAAWRSVDERLKQVYGVQVRVWMRSVPQNISNVADANVLCYAGDVELRHATLASEERGSTGSGPKVVVPYEWTLLSFGSRIDVWDFVKADWIDDQFYFEVDLTAAVLFANGSRVPDATPRNTVQCQVGAADIAIYYGDSEVGTTDRQVATLVDLPQTWQYGVHGDAARAPTQPSLGWELPSYDMAADAANWRSGSGHFGFGDAAITTTLPSARQTAYFRTVFNVNADDLRCSGDIHMRIRFNDAVVVYLNGAMVWNNNVDMQQTRRYTTNSIRTLGNADLYRFVTLGPGHLQLVAGENLLAIELRQSATPSSNDLHLQANLFLYRLWPTCDGASTTTTVPTTTRTKTLVATSNPSPTMSSQLSTTLPVSSTNSSGPEHGPSSATTVGILAAVVVLLLVVLGGVGVWIWRKKKAKRQVETYMTLKEEEGGTDF